MLALVGTVLAVLVAAGVALVVLGLAASAERRWRVGAIQVVAGLALMFVAQVVLAGAAHSLIGPGALTNDISPDIRARVLAESISGLMNVAALGVPAGLLGGILLAWRRRVRAKAR
jgi:hypothetical protein